MRSIKWLLAAAALAGVAAVSGCAYDDTYSSNPYAYNDFQYDRYAYGYPNYYVAPSVSFGLARLRYGSKWNSRADPGLSSAANSRNTSKSRRSASF